MDEFISDHQLELENILTLKNSSNDMFKNEERKGLSKNNIPILSDESNQKTEIENLKKQLTLSSQNILDLEALTFTNAKKYQDKITDLKNIIKQLRKDLNTEKERRRESEERIKKFKSNNSKEIEELKSEVVQWKMRHSAHLTNSKREINALKCDIMDAQGALDRELQQRDELEELLDLAKQQLSKVAEERQSLEKRIATAEAETKSSCEAARRAVAAATDHRARAEATEKEATEAKRELQEIKEKVKKKGSWFW